MSTFYGATDRASAATTPRILHHCQVHPIEWPTLYSPVLLVRLRLVNVENVKWIMNIISLLFLVVIFCISQYFFFNYIYFIVFLFNLLKFCMLNVHYWHPLPFMVCRYLFSFKGLTIRKFYIYLLMVFFLLVLFWFFFWFFIKGCGYNSK